MIQWLLSLWRRRREAREEEALRGLKAKYHTFRSILDGNERALELLSGFDAALLNRKGLDTLLEELLAVTFELVDGVNRLSCNRHAALYTLHEDLSAALREAAPGLAPYASKGGPGNSSNSFADAPLILGFEALGRIQAGLVGGKAAFLGELLNAGVEVPPGFAATTFACRMFLELNGLGEVIQQKLGHLAEVAPDAVNDSEADVSQAAREVQLAILEAPVPPALVRALLAGWRVLGEAPVSVRSSALAEDRPEHSFAGQFTSVLNVITEEALLDAYRRVIASNFGPRPLAYRLRAGLPALDFDMAVAFQAMVDARVAGVMFTMHPTEPESGRLLITAVPGLGTRAVGGSAPADIFLPLRENPSDIQSFIAEKGTADVVDADGGLRSAALTEQEVHAPVLTREEVESLVQWGVFAESLFGAPQDLEWAIDRNNRLKFLQSRTIPLRGKGIRVASRLRGKPLLSGGICASSGRAAGVARIVRSEEDLQAPLPEGAVVLVLRQSMVNAAPLLSKVEAVVVELGNPTDHLSCVARELGLPMLTGADGATEAIAQGASVILDADEHQVLEAPANFTAAPRHREARQVKRELPSLAARVREMVVPLHLTDAYGPTFSIQECHSLHDIVRFCHEKALMGMFQAGDEVAGEADSLIKWLAGVPLHFLIIDLGGGLLPEVGRKVLLEELRSAPLAALCQGMLTPGLRWRQAPPQLSVQGLMSRSITDQRGERPLGTQNYALISRDYLNLNARVDYHFAMVDSVCGPFARENHIRFRFKGGGTTQAQRERRAAFIGKILHAKGFFIDTRGDLVTASLSGEDMEKTAEQLRMLGRLLGFSRLMDGAMTNDDAPEMAAQAFLQGNLSLEGVEFQA